MRRRARTFRLPRGAERYLVLQRVSYAWKLPAPLRRARLQRLYDRYAFPSVERVRRPLIARRYSTELTADYTELRPFLPTAADRILDVGCGIAGIDSLLFRHYAQLGGRPRVSLLDKEGVSEIFYGFRHQAAYYNSLDLAREFLVLNGVPRSAIDTIDVGTSGFPVERRYEIVVSLLSWGHHYPISTYLDEVERVLSPDGIVVLDVRRETTGEEALRERFGRIELVRRGRVSDRLAVWR